MNPRWILADPELESSEYISTSEIVAEQITGAEAPDVDDMDMMRMNAMNPVSLEQATRTAVFDTYAQNGMEPTVSEFGSFSVVWRRKFFIRRRRNTDSGSACLRCT